MRNNRWGLIPLVLSLVLSLAGCAQKAPEETGDGTDAAASRTVRRPVLAGEYEQPL